MKRKLIIFLIAMMLLSIAVCFVGCDDTDKILQTPQNLRQERRTVTWDSVDNAQEYIVFVNGEEYKTTENSFDLNFLIAGTYRIEVMAVGEYNDSQRVSISVVLTQPVEKGKDELGFLYTILSNGSGYEVSQGTAKLDGVVTIPDYFCGLPVKSIAEYGFCSHSTHLNYFTKSNCNTVTTKINLPKNLETINRFGLACMTELEEVIIPDGVTDIKNFAFWGDTNLRNVVLSKSLKIIGRGAFCDTPLKELVLPESLEEIWDEAFLISEDTYGSLPRIKSELSSVIFPDSVKFIGRRAFFGRENLFEIVLPENIEKINAEAFHDTDWYLKQPNGLVALGDVLYEYKGEMPEIYTIPSNIKQIAGMAFHMQTNVKKIVIPDGVSFSGDGIFQYCISLTEIVLPSDLEKLHGYELFLCQSLEKIILPKSLKMLGNCVFDKGDKVFYEGSLLEWQELIDASKTTVFWGELYTYSSEKPTELGSFWHYDVDGITPIIWETTK